MLKKYEKNTRFAIIYAILLAAFTLYAALDTFVIARTYSPAVTDSAGDTTINGAAGSTTFNGAAGITTGSEDSGGYAVILPSDGEGQEVSYDEDAQSQTAEPSQDSAQSVKISSSSYSDNNISINIEEFEVYNTTVHVADITLSSAKYLKTAFANNAYGRNVKDKTSQIASDNGAILAINGDFYGSQQSGYVIRNGVLYRDTARSGQEDLVIYSDGSFEIIKESQVTAQELVARGAVQVLGFGPALVENGSVAVGTSDEVGKAMASNPRTAIGIIDDLHYVMVVSDGRTSESEGLSLYQLAQVMQALGTRTAYNLDGGGSSTMVFNGNIINIPSNSGGRERSVSDIVYIGY